jgi:hypothetical protein
VWKLRQGLPLGQQGAILLGTSRRARRILALGVSLALTAAGCSGDDGADASGDVPGDQPGAGLPEAYTDHRSELYADEANWLCRPGKPDNACSQNLDTTVVNADGTTEVQTHEPADAPPVDCFYVYPTTSLDETPNSDLEAAPEQEVHTAHIQAARLNATCRVFAPIYRQLTLGAITSGEGDAGQTPGESPVWQSAYDDVLDAFRHFIANDSQGRPFVLVGHSQGAEHLRRLVAEEIDDQPGLRDRLVSALLLGWPVALPEDPTTMVGGDFQNVPLCQAPAQTGCVVAYSSFRSTSPPPPNAAFGRPFGGAEGRAACVNPASPGGGPAALHPYFLVEQPQGAVLGAPSEPFTDPARTAEITTPFVTYPDLITAECVIEGEFSYLELTINADPADPRADDIGGDLTPDWGTHLVDVNVAMGDLVELVRTQAEAFPL